MSPLDLSGLPPVLLLSTHLTSAELTAAEDALLAANAPLTYSISEAKLFLGKVSQKRRALLELRGLGLWTEEVISTSRGGGGGVGADEPSRKKRRRRSSDEEHDESNKKKLVVVIDESATESEGEDGGEKHEEDVSGHVKVVRLAWLGDCMKSGKIIPLREHLVYEGRPTGPATKSTSIQMPAHSYGNGSATTAKSVASIYGYQAETQPESNETSKAQVNEKQPPEPHMATTQPSNPHRSFNSRRITHLIHETTSEHESGASSEIPEPPPWVLDHATSTYACCRVTPATGPNDAFIECLKKIRLTRNLTADEIGVRAYSSAIAAIAAYPYSLTSPREILHLPGCENKIATLFVEWKNNDGVVREAQEVDTEPRLVVLNIFYNIWGVGPHTAREFHDAHGWRDLDDVVEFGWAELSRVQQIGVKYYDEFLLGIPRAEVEAIGRIVHEHAQKIREPAGVRSCIVGGHRRGKQMSGDVDIVVSHTDEDATLNIVTDIVASLVDSGWVTHELITSLQGTQRNQAPLPFKGTPSGHGLKGGFDTLDKSMVVWQDPNWDGMPKQESKAKEGLSTPERKQLAKKNPNPHRRVDIIIAPWSKAGCAVMGWSSGTTFQRDLRRWSTNVKGWKFDSSGVRDRRNGEVVDFEEISGSVSKSMEEAEKKVFIGMGLEYREPWERCTG